MKTGGIYKHNGFYASTKENAKRDGRRSENEDGMRRNTKTMREDRGTKGQWSVRNQFPLGVAGSGQWSANATL